MSNDQITSFRFTNIGVSIAEEFCTDDNTDEEDRYTLRCPTHVQQRLQPHKDRRAQAVKDRDRARMECTRLLQTQINPQHRLGELQAESHHLCERLVILRKQCAEMAVRVASQAVQNDMHREESSQLFLKLSSSGGGGGGGGGTPSPQEQLERFEQSLLQGSLHHAIDVATKQVRMLRFQWARKALAMHRLDVDPNDVVNVSSAFSQRQQGKASYSGSGSSSSTSDKVSNMAILQQPRRARGIGKIGGLPLPHAGPELYGVLPPKELQSALRLVASVTCTVARCLGIVLPHPILLTVPSASSSSGSSMTGMATGGADITNTVSDHELQRRLRETHHGPADRDEDHTTTTTTTTSTTAIPSSISGSIMSLVDTSYWKKSAKKALALATGHNKSSLNMLPSTSSTFAQHPTIGEDAMTPSMDSSSQLSLRIQYATAAVLAEDHSPSSSKFALSSEVIHQQDFAIALQLLQNNVVVLCIRAGVPVGQLWPGEAILLNLYQLDQYCQDQTGVSY